jgi:hypothetical protein
MLIFSFCGGESGTPSQPQPIPDLTEIEVNIQGEVDINGTKVSIKAEGKLDSRTGAYTLSGVGPASGNLSPREKLLLSFIPRSAFAFMGTDERTSLLTDSKESLKVNLQGRRKVGEVGAIEGKLELSKKKNTVSVQCSGRITTGSDRMIESDGEAVLRLGVNPNNRTFVGGARINYDIAKPDPAGLGTADFWNFRGTFSGKIGSANHIYAHVDQCGGVPAKGLFKGVLLNFPASTVFLPGVITLSGKARKDGLIHQYMGVANQAGGGHTILTFTVRIKKGMMASDVARLVAEGFNHARQKKTAPEAQYLLAVQGGDGVNVLEQNPESAQVVVSMTVNEGKSIASPTDSRAIAVFSQAATQAFSDQAVLAAENTGIRNQFGVLGQSPLTGWLTPFKAVYSTNNPAHDFKAAGGEVAILLNWTEHFNGNKSPEGSTTSFKDLVVKTNAGETAEQIVTRLVNKLKGQRTRWGSHPFIQRDGNILYVDAGIEFPHSVSLASNDEGVGYMSAAADLPFYREPLK